MRDLLLRGCAGLGRGARFYRKDGEIRADDFTIMAVDALIRFLHRRWMIALGIELGRNFKDIPGAKNDAVAAAFATVGDDVHNSS